MLRLPWPEWGETDVMLGMAADLHDQLVCSCGCGQWLDDAHDPEKADRWDVDTGTCYVRRAIDAYVTKFEPGADSVLSVRLVTDRAEADRSEYEAIVARHAASFAKRADERPPAPDEGGEGEQG